MLCGDLNRNKIQGRGDICVCVCVCVWLIHFAVQQKLSKSNYIPIKIIKNLKIENLNNPKTSEEIELIFEIIPKRQAQNHSFTNSRKYF